LPERQIPLLAIVRAGTPSITKEAGLTHCTVKHGCGCPSASVAGQPAIKAESPRVSASEPLRIKRRFPVITGVTNPPCGQVIVSATVRSGPMDMS